MNYKAAINYAKKKLSQYDWNKKQSVDKLAIFNKVLQKEAYFHSSFIKYKNCLGDKAILSKTFIFYFNEEMDSYLAYLSDKNVKEFFNVLDSGTRSNMFFKDKHIFDVELFLMSYTEFLKKWELVEKELLPIVRISYPGYVFDVFKNGRITLNGEIILKNLKKNLQDREYTIRFKKAVSHIDSFVFHLFY